MTKQTLWYVASTAMKKMFDSTKIRNEYQKRISDTHMWLMYVQCTEGRVLCNTTRDRLFITHLLSYIENFQRHDTKCLRHNTVVIICCLMHNQFTNSVTAIFSRVLPAVVDQASVVRQHFPRNYFYSEGGHSTNWLQIRDTVAKNTNNGTLIG